MIPNTFGPSSRGYLNDDDGAKKPYKTVSADFESSGPRHKRSLTTVVNKPHGSSRGERVNRRRKGLC